MALSEKTQFRLMIITILLFIISLVYNLTRDPRSLYTPEDNDRKILSEQARERKKQEQNQKPGSLLKMHLLEKDKPAFRSHESRNIFKFETRTRIIEEEPVVQVKPPIAETKTQETEAPVIQSVGSLVPYTYIGFAITEGRNIAILQDKRTTAMIVVYQGFNLGSEYSVKTISPKIVTLLNNNTNTEHQLNIKE